MLCGCIDIGTNTTRVLVAEARDGRLTRGAAAARVHAPGPRADAGRRDPGAPGSPRTPASSPSSVALAEQAGARPDPHRRHGGDPQRRQPRRVLSPRCASTAASRSRVLDGRGGGAAGVPRRHADARAARSTGASAVVDVGGGSTEIAVGTVDGGVDWWRVVPRSAPASSPTRTCAATRRRPPSSTRCATHAAEVLARHRRRRRSTSRSRSAAARPRCGGSSATMLDAREPASARSRVLAGGPAADVARALRRSTPQRVRLMPAGLLALDAAAQRARPAAADRPRRPARGRAARPAPGCNNSFTDPHRGCDDPRRDRRHQPPETAAAPDLDGSARCTSTASCRGWSSTTRVLELAEDPRRPAAGAREVLRDRLVQPRRVLHGPRRRPARPDRRRHREAAAGRAHAERDDRRDPRDVVREHAARQSRCLDRDLRPALAEHGIRIVGYDEVERRSERRRSTSASGARSSPC